MCIVGTYLIFRQLSLQTRKLVFQENSISVDPVLQLLLCCIMFPCGIHLDLDLNYRAYSKYNLLPTGLMFSKTRIARVLDEIRKAEKLPVDVNTDLILA